MGDTEIAYHGIKKIERMFPNIFGSDCELEDFIYVSTVPKLHVITKRKFPDLPPEVKDAVRNIFVVDQEY